MTCLTTASEIISQSFTMTSLIEDSGIDTTLDSKGGNLLSVPLNNTMCGRIVLISQQANVTVYLMLFFH